MPWQDRACMVLSILYAHARCEIMKRTMVRMFTISKMHILVIYYAGKYGKQVFVDANN